jgi:hypothetical protein
MQGRRDKIEQTRARAEKIMMEVEIPYEQADLVPSEIMDHICRHNP